MDKSITDLFIDELHDILSSEKQIVKALPIMANAAEAPELKEAFKLHLTETKKQVQRLEQIFKLLKIESTEKFCKGTRGLIQECQDIIKDFKKSPVRDAALISKAQRIEHYEISAYGTVRTFAKEIDLDNQIANLLQTTLDEEANADKKLTKIAEGGLLRTGINHKANIATNGATTHTAPKAKKKAAVKRAVAKKAVKRTVAKKAATKRPAVKKAAVKRTVAKKAVKRAVAKKAVKRTVAKKVVKRAVAKKAVKHAVAKKAVKRAVAKKAVKRTVAKKTASKKVATKGSAFSVKRKTARKSTSKRKSASKR